MAHKIKGFTTVYLLMILSALVMAIVMIINAASGAAARSEVESVCAMAGRSVLSEYQKELYDRYGIFALRADDAMLTRLSKFYINGSLITLKALVRPVAIKVQASAEAHPGLETAAFGKQVRRLAPGAALTKGNLLEYLKSLMGGPEEGSPEVPDSGGDGAEAIKRAERELSREKGGATGNTISSRDSKRLPSKLLGYPKRLSLLLSGGIFDLSFSAAIEDEYMMAVCSYALEKKENCYMEKEVEYILYGNLSDAANFKSVKLSLFALRMAVNEVKYASETGELLISTAAAAVKSLEEVRILLSGGTVDKLDYAMYLRILLALLPRNEKLARLMDIMQLNITKVDGAHFSFRNYAYGFDLEARFVLKARTGDVSQTHIYR